MNRRTLLTAAVAATMAATMAACTKSVLDLDAPPGGVGPAAPAPAPFDPPLAFSEEAAVALGTPADRTSYAVHNGIAYLVADDPSERDDAALTAVEIATGTQRWSVEIDNPRGGSLPRPALAEIGPRLVVFLPLVVRVEGSGTRPARRSVQVVARDAATGEQLWATELDEPEATRGFGRDGARGGRGWRVQANASHVMVTVDRRYTAMLDAGSGAIRWREAGFQGRVLDGDVVAGQEVDGRGFDGAVRQVGRSAVNGDELWRITDLDQTFEISGLGPGLAFFVGGEGRREVSTYLVRVATGERVAEFGWGGTCRHNGETIVVCSTVDFYDGDDRMLAYDTQEGRVLWELPAEGRVAPESLQAVRLGAVYATTENGPMVLDARTGEDRVAELPFAPVGVGPGYVLRLDRSGTLYAHPASA